ncbi:MAG: hypothetical protein OJF62_000987 [Pseudolabrys sp.]|jgi:AraC-like DNA-binding protein|nr:hypothetical protein [Pseudolabrys sp.]
MDNGRLSQFDFGGLMNRAREALPADLARAVKWINSHLSEPVRIDMLAQVAGVPPRTLEAHFRQYLNTTPLGWLRRMRLAAARQALLTSGGAVSVTAAATRAGFSQLGRFSGAYREAFGELPSQTRRRAGQHGPRGAGEIDDRAVLLTWRAVTEAYQVAPDSCSAALDDVAQAQELAPRYGLAKALQAWCIGQSAVHNFHMQDLNAQGGGRAQSIGLAAEAEALAPDDALALSLCSGALTLAHRLDDADRLIERAIAMDPWSALIWLRRGWISAYSGDSDAAIRELDLTMRLMPFEPVRHIVLIGIGCAHFAAGRYDHAARWVREGVKANPGSFWAERVAIAAAAHLGARGEARRGARALLRKDPDFTIETARRAWPVTPDFRARLGDGLALAGVPRA